MCTPGTYKEPAPPEYFSTGSAWASCCANSTISTHAECSAAGARLYAYASPAVNDSFNSEQRFLPPGCYLSSCYAHKVPQCKDATLSFNGGIFGFGNNKKIKTW